MSDPRIRERKHAMRSELRRRRAARDPAEVARRSVALAASLVETRVWGQARRIAAFVGLGGEPDTRPLLELALASGRVLLLPRVESLRPPRMGFVNVTDLGGLQPGRLGIPEPPRGEAGAPLAILRPDLVLVPGLSFSEQGARPGQGMGFYDAALADLVDVVTVGVVFADALVREDSAIPQELHDVRVTHVVSESGLRSCR